VLLPLSGAPRPEAILTVTFTITPPPTPSLTAIKRVEGPARVGYAPTVQSRSDSNARNRRGAARGRGRAGVPGRLQEIHALLKAKGLKHSAVRDVVLEEFFGAGSHVSIEELLARVRRRAPTAGYSTVYRTLRLLVESGQAVARDFGGAQTLFEPADTRHHDHVVCLRCGVIREFEEAAIEDLQEKVARRLGFQVTSHRLELYGLCAACAAGRAG